MENLKKYTAAVLFLGMITFWNSCTLFDEPEPQAAFLHLSGIDLSTTSNEGSASSKINIAWVYVNDKFLGGFQMPVTIPVLEDGAATVLIDPGINANGVSFTPDLYPFYKRIEFNHNFTPGKVDTFSFTTQYSDLTEFAFIEDFSSSTHLFSDDRDDDTETFIAITSEDAFEGNSGLIRLTKTHPVAIVATNYDRIKLDNLPRNGLPAWLEVNYKTDVPVVIGVIAYDAIGSASNFPEFGINPRNDWNKIYFNMSDLLLQQNLRSFQIYVSAAIPRENGEFKQDEGSVYLDNIKLVYRAQ